MTVSLSHELQTDPEGLGYAELLYNAQDQKVADLLNRKTGAGAELVVLPSLTRSQLLLALVPVLTYLTELSSSTQEKWKLILQVICSVEAIEMLDPRVQAIFDAAVEDGIMTQEYADSIGTRLGSRAEVLWGAGTIITADQVGAAR